MPRGGRMRPTPPGPPAPHPVFGHFEMVPFSSSAQYTAVSSRAMPVGLPAPAKMVSGPSAASAGGGVSITAASAGPASPAPPDPAPLAPPALASPASALAG